MLPLHHISMCRLSALPAPSRIDPYMFSRVAYLRALGRAHTTDTIRPGRPPPPHSRLVPIRSPGRETRFIPGTWMQNPGWRSGHPGFFTAKQIHGESHPAHSLYGHIVVEHNSPKKRPGEPHRPGQVQANGESYCAKRTDEKVCGSRAITAVIS